VILSGSSVDRDRLVEEILGFAIALEGDRKAYSAIQDPGALDRKAGPG
jgi:hypothetical protein